MYNTFHQQRSRHLLRIAQIIIRREIFMKQKMRKIMCLAFALILSMGLLAGCGGSDDSDDVVDVEDEELTTLAGTSWDCDENEDSFVFYDDTTGAESGYYTTVEFTYTFDGTTVYIDTDFDISFEGTLEDGYLVFESGTYVQVDSATYVQGGASGGAEADLNGSWCDSTTGSVLTFDGVENVQYEVTDGIGGGTYSYDGETLTVSVIGDSGEVEDHEGYVDDDGNIVITVFGDDSYYEYTGGSSDDDSSSSSSSYQLSGTYYNEDEDVTIETSIEYLCWIMTDTEYLTGTYSIDESGAMTITGSDDSFTVYGTYDYDGDYFTLDDYEGTFNYQ